MRGNPELCANKRADISYFCISTFHKLLGNSFVNYCSGSAEVVTILESKELKKTNNGQLFTGQQNL